MTVILPNAVLGSRFRLSRIQRRVALTLDISLALVCLLFALVSSAQSDVGQGLPQRRQARTATAPSKVAATPAAAPATPANAPAVAPAPAPVAQAQTAPPAPAEPPKAPPQPPNVVWDGVNLTIDAENSTLASILLAVRQQTGASVDMPGSTASERVAVHIGPAPVREVLSTLLYGTDFDYVIQAPDDNEAGLRSVIITQRGKGDDIVVADDKPGVRHAPGYSGSAKPTFQAEAEAALENAAQSAAADAASSAPVDDSKDPNTKASAAGDGNSAAPASAPSTSTPSGDQSADAAQPTPDSGTPALAADTPSANSNGNRPVTTALTSGVVPTVGSGTNFSQMVQDMTSMFEQRRQIQAQQNQATKAGN